MKIGILGGTGNMGSGLALRLSLKHDITVGSRSIEKAVDAAGELKAKALGFYQTAMKGSIRGVLNEDVIEGMDVVDKIKSVPTARSGPHDDVPMEPVTITSVKRQ